MDVLQTYLERSKSVPLSASLSCPELTDLVIPHTSRLTGLAIQLDRPLGFREIMHRLPHPIPTLRTFCISDDHRHHLEPPPLRFLRAFLFAFEETGTEGITSFNGSWQQVFPLVTELTLDIEEYFASTTIPFLGRLPSLERVNATFHGIAVGILHDLDTHRVVTLPRVREMSLSMPNRTGGSHFPNILEFLHLPMLESLRIEAPPKVINSVPIFPVRNFGEGPPNFAQLPELQVDMGLPSNQVTFEAPLRQVSNIASGYFQTTTQMNA